MRRTVAALAAALVVAVGLLIVSGQQASAQDYSDAKLDAFVTAMLEVSKRIEDWRPKIEGTEDEEARNALIEEATADLRRAVEETDGISSEEYRKIYDTAREDEALRNRIDDLLTARQ